MGYLPTEPVPCATYHFTESKDWIVGSLETNLIDAAKSFTLDAFENYRILILKYLYDIKKSAEDGLANTKLKAPKFLLTTILYHVCNKAQITIEAYHQEVMNRFKNYEDAYFVKHDHLMSQEQHILFDHLYHYLHEYEAKMDEVRETISKSLKLMYGNRILQNGIRF